MSNPIPTPNIPPQAGRYTRREVCDVCILKGTGKGPKDSLERMDYEDGMASMAMEGKGIWTCAKALWGQEEDKNFRPQCKLGMIDYVKKRKELGLE